MKILLVVLSLVLSLVLISFSTFAQDSEWAYPPDPIDRHILSNKENREEFFKGFYTNHNWDGASTSMGVGVNKWGPVLSIQSSIRFVMFEIGFGLKNPSGGIDPIGEHYSVINWDAYPEDVYETGGYWEASIYWALGGTYKGFYLLAGVEGANYISVRNCFDNYHILGNNGYYTKGGVSDRISEPYFKFGKNFHVKEVKDMIITTGVGYSELSGVSVSVGVGIAFDNY